DDAGVAGLRLVRAGRVDREIAGVHDAALRAELVADRGVAVDDLPLSDELGRQHRALAAAAAHAAAAHAHATAAASAPTAVAAGRVVVARHTRAQQDHRKYRESHGVSLFRPA